MCVVLPVSKPYRTTLGDKTRILLLLPLSTLNPGELGKYPSDACQDLTKRGLLASAYPRMPRRYWKGNLHELVHEGILKN